MILVLVVVIVAIAYCSMQMDYSIQLLPVVDSRFVVLEGLVVVPKPAVVAGPKLAAAWLPVASTRVAAVLRASVALVVGLTILVVAVAELVDLAAVGIACTPRKRLDYQIYHNRFVPVAVVAGAFVAVLVISATPAISSILLPPYLTARLFAAPNLHYSITFSFFRLLRLYVCFLPTLFVNRHHIQYHLDLYSFFSFFWGSSSLSCSYFSPLLTCPHRTKDSSIPWL